MSLSLEAPGPAMFNVFIKNSSIKATSRSPGSPRRLTASPASGGRDKQGRFQSAAKVFVKALRPDRSGLKEKITVPSLSRTFPPLRWK